MLLLNESSNIFFFSIPEGYFDKLLERRWFAKFDEAQPMICTEMEWLIE
jgi:hypothetical protein